MIVSLRHSNNPGAAPKAFTLAELQKKLSDVTGCIAECLGLGDVWECNSGADGDEGQARSAMMGSFTPGSNT